MNKENKMDIKVKTVCPIINKDIEIIFIDESKKIICPYVRKRYKKGTWFQPDIYERICVFPGGDKFFLEVSKTFDLPICCYTNI
jgi:hypothetical protein